jgi:uncharacterized protein YuzE
VTYCAVDDKNECSEQLLLDISQSGEVNQIELGNLKAFTRYKISIALLSRIRHGVFKSPISVKTLESGE